MANNFRLGNDDQQKQEQQAKEQVRVAFNNGADQFANAIDPFEPPKAVRIRQAWVQQKTALLQGKKSTEELTPYEFDRYLRDSVGLGAIGESIQQNQDPAVKEALYKKLLPDLKTIDPDAPDQYSEDYVLAAVSEAKKISQGISGKPDIKVASLIVTPKGKSPEVRYAQLIEHNIEKPLIKELSQSGDLKSDNSRIFLSDIKQLTEKLESIRLKNTALTQADKVALQTIYTQLDTYTKADIKDRLAHRSKLDELHNSLVTSNASETNTILKEIEKQKAKGKEDRKLKNLEYSLKVKEELSKTDAINRSILESAFLEDYNKKVLETDKKKYSKQEQEFLHEISEDIPQIKDVVNLYTKETKSEADLDQILNLPRGELEAQILKGTVNFDLGVFKDGSLGGK